VATPTGPNQPPVAFDSQEYVQFEDDLVGADPGTQAIWFANTAGRITKGDFSGPSIPPGGPLPDPALTSVDASGVFQGAPFSVFALSKNDEAWIASGNQTSVGDPETDDFSEPLNGPGTVVDIFPTFGTEQVSVLTTAPVTVGTAVFTDEVAGVARSGADEFIVVNGRAGARLLRNGAEEAAFPDAKAYSVAASAKYWVVGLTGSSGGDPRVAVYENAELKYEQPVAGTPELLKLRGDLLYAVTRSGSLQIEPFDIAKPTALDRAAVVPYNLSTNGRVLRMAFPLEQTNSTALPAFLWVLLKD